jgi:hypothetical protein
MDSFFIYLGVFAAAGAALAGWCFFSAWRAFRTRTASGSSGLNIFLAANVLAGLLALLFAGFSLLLLIGLMGSTDL